MNVLIVGSGGREHALAWLLSRSKSVSSILVVPGNPGIERVAKCSVRGSSYEIDTVRDIARTHQPDLIVVGPAEPLLDGIADSLRSDGFDVVGPPRAAAEIGCSKTAAKEVMERYGIPTPEYRTCDDPDAAIAAVEEFDTPVMVKADGLASGTGVVLCHTRESAELAIDGALRQRRFGAAGDRVVIERHVPGTEVSLTVLVDESGYVMLPTALDHTQIGEGGTGPNTLGMGAIVPNPEASPDTLKQIENTIVKPTVRALADLTGESGIGYRGVIHLILLLSESGPQLLGYKVRFGDPETQALVSLIRGDFAVLLRGLARGRLLPAVEEASFSVADGAACTVVAAITGYPGPYTRGQTITDRAGVALEAPVVSSASDAPEKAVPTVPFGPSVQNDQIETAQVFYCAVEEKNSGDSITFLANGGRVLSVSAMGATLRDARIRAYARLLQISFDGMVFRRDIGGEPVITAVIEEGRVFLPQFEKRGGVLPVVVQDVETGDVLMLAYANVEALRMTREKRLATFWSTGRGVLWTKGETSGDTLMVEEIRVDCDQDALVYRVRMNGPGVCHTRSESGEHRRRCFYRILRAEGMLEHDE